MTDSRPFPMHVPTLTEVVEEPLISSDEAVVVDEMEPLAADLGPGVNLGVGTPPLDVPVLDEVVVPEAAQADVVVSSSGLPPVESLLDESDLSESGRMVAVAESGDLTPELAEQLTDQITENMTAAMTPFIEGLAQQIALQLQEEFSHRLRAMVSQAVMQELNQRRL